MAKDPYKYFRVEARELLEGLTQGILQLEKDGASPDAIARLLRLAHTLKGAARVVKQPEIAELAHTIEGALTSHRETKQPLSKEQGTALLGFLDGMSSRLQALEPGSAVTAARAAQPAAEEPIETLRVEIQEIDLLLRGVTETGVQLGSVRKRLAVADRIRDLAGLLVDQLAARPGENGAASSSSNLRARSLAEELRSSLDRVRRGLAVDVELYLDLQPAGTDDDLARTVDYGQVFELCRDLVEATNFRLLETIAEGIAHEILVAHPVAEVVVRVRKLRVPVSGLLDHAEVEIRRTRATAGRRRRRRARPG